MKPNNRFQGTLHKVSGPLNRDVGHTKFLRSDEQPKFRWLAEERLEDKRRSFAIPENDISVICSGTAPGHARIHCQ